MTVTSKIVPGVRVPDTNLVVMTGTAVRPLRGNVRFGSARIADIVMNAEEAKRPRWTIASEIHAHLNDGRVSLEGLNDLVDATFADDRFNASYADIGSRLHHVLRCMYSLLR